MTSTKQSFQDLQHKKIALVYDWFDSWGGAERVLLTLHQMFPHGDWFTSYNQGATWAQDFQVRTSFMQNLGFLKGHKNLVAGIFPMAFESFDFTGYDVVISVTSSYAKGIITKPGIPHICLMLTPTRFLWIKEHEYLTPMQRFFLQPLIKHLKAWDLIAAQRPDKIIAISKTVAKRIQEIYGREADVVYPPFDVDYWETVLRVATAPQVNFPHTYHLLVSRLRPYKKVELAIKAFNTMKDRHLVIVGSGPAAEVARLKRIAGRNIHFLSDLKDTELAYLYGHAQALIMPQEEDFGYTALEALACGCAVIAFDKGGATETVKHKKTGYLFPLQTVESLREAVENFQAISYTVERYLQTSSRQEVEPFAQEIFIKKFTESL